MALTDGNGSDLVMPVAPMYGGNGFGNNNGFGGDWAWIILLLLLGWGNNGWGNNGGGFGGGGIYPWMNQANLTSEGFQNQLMNDNITSIRDGVHGISTQLCNCCSDVQMALATGFAGVEQGANARAMADMNRSFALQSQFADCCCENRLATADLKYTVASENCADRYEAAQNTASIIQSQSDGTRAILDKLCSLELDAKNTKIADLERQLTMANLAASQTAQTGRILADNAAQTVALEQYLNPVPIPAYVVQNPNCCSQNNCGCGSF